MADNHCDNCDQDAPHADLVPFAFMGGVGLRHRSGCGTDPRIAEMVAARGAGEITSPVMILDDVVTTREVATVALEMDPADLEKFVYGLPAARVPEWDIVLKGWIDTLTMIHETFEKRMTIDGITEYRDPASAALYRFIGRPGNREVEDPEGLVNALRGDVADEDIEKALPKKRTASMSGLDALAKKWPKAAPVISSFVRRKPRGPAHLTIVVDGDGE